MKRILPLLCLLALIASPLPAAAAWDINQLMSELAQTPSGKARFVEKKYIALLDKPVISSGELSFSAPDRLEKRTIKPRPERITLVNDALEIEHDGKRFSLRLSSRPEAVAFVGSIRGALTGNRKLLEENYALLLSGNQENWSLRLLPSDTAIAALLSYIDIRGSRNRIHSVEYQLSDGDRTVMSITPLEAAK